MMTLPDQIADKIDVGDCWEWTGEISSNGYGRAWYQGRHPGAHRLVWELMIGPIPEGLVIDHLCKNRCCVNPDHLEPVTQKENARRGETGASERVKTHCPQGHPYYGDNLHIRPNGKRHCRACHRGQELRRYHARRAV